MPEKQEKGGGEVVWNITVKERFDAFLSGVLERHAYTSKSEFVRQAVREKLERMNETIDGDL